MRLSIYITQVHGYSVGVYSRIPLARILKGRLLRVAELQDLLVIELAKRFDFVLHGGTAVWRVYGGKRLSIDVDIYCREPERIGREFKSLPGIRVVREKLTPSRVLYLRVADEFGAEVELEASPPFREIEVTEADYWTTDGGSLVLRVLTSCDLLREKIAAFRDRGKARDLYDVYYLLDLCEDPGIGVELRSILPKLEIPPPDFGGLRELILLGRPPSFESIVRKVRRHAEA